jgi:hypothetical protein
MGRSAIDAPVAMTSFEEGPERFVSLQAELAAFWAKRLGGQPSSANAYLRQGAK